MEQVTSAGTETLTSCNMELIAHPSSPANVINLTCTYQEEDQLPKAAIDCSHVSKPPVLKNKEHNIWYAELLAKETNKFRIVTIFITAVPKVPKIKNCSWLTWNPTLPSISIDTACTTSYVVWRQALMLHVLHDIPAPVPIALHHHLSQHVGGWVKQQERSSCNANTIYTMWKKTFHLTKLPLPRHTNSYLIWRWLQSKMVLRDSCGLWSSKWSCDACHSAAQAHPTRDETKHKGRLYHPTWARSPSWPSSSFIRWVQPANFRYNFPKEPDVIPQLDETFWHCHFTENTDPSLILFMRSDTNLQNHLVQVLELLD